MTRTIHACAVVIGEAGLLIRGASGSGKSALALALIEEALARGRFARLVADDRVLLRRAGGRLIAEPHPAIAGLLEERGRGIMPHAHETNACLRGVVDLGSIAENGEPRLPEAADCVESIDGIPLRRVFLPSSMPKEPAVRRLLAIF